MSVRHDRRGDASSSKSATQAEEDKAARNLSLYDNPFGRRTVEGAMPPPPAGDAGSGGGVAAVA